MATKMKNFRLYLVTSGSQAYSSDIQMWHNLMDLYQVCSDNKPRVKIDLTLRTIFFYNHRVKELSNTKLFDI